MTSLCVFILSVENYLCDEEDCMCVVGLTSAVATQCMWKANIW